MKIKNKILGIHHITALAGDAQRNVDFYVGVLGLRFVKKSINQDVPDVYHLYYGDEIGSPGTVMTFFPFGRAARGVRGNGEVSRVAFSVPTESLDFWVSYLSKNSISFDGPSERFGEQYLSFLDPDGMLVDLVFTEKHSIQYPWKKSPVPVEKAIRGFHGVTINVAEPQASEHVLNEVLGFRKIGETGRMIRFVAGTGNDEAAIDLNIDPVAPHARQSAGSVHHIAWRVKDFPSHEEWYRYIRHNGLPVSEIIDRFYFHSIYFREPGGVLYEIASDNPGFTVDESLENLGKSLVVPPWYEREREKIERALPPISVPVWK